MPDDEERGDEERGDEEELELDWEDELPTQRRSYSRFELELSKIAEELPKGVS